MSKMRPTPLLLRAHGSRLMARGHPPTGEEGADSSARSIPAPLPVVAALLVAAAACTPRADRPPAQIEDVAPSRLAVVVASFDLAAGNDQRLLVGVFTPDRKIVGGGEIAMRVWHGDEGLGTAEDAVGRFLAVPGSGTPSDLLAPTLLGEPASHDHEPGQAATPHDHGEPTAAGVYAARVDLDRPGIWEVAVTAVVDGTPLTGTAAFQVLPSPLVPAPGDPAPTTHTPTLHDDLPLEAIDSRAVIAGEIPDEALHQIDLADALEAAWPAVVVFSTPTYCISRFCGPITDTVEDLATRFGDRAAFVHVEIWRDIGAGELNAASEEWISTPEGGNEPWVFLVGADGVVTARWDNVLDPDELISLLEGLPVVPALAGR